MSRSTGLAALVVAMIVVAMAVVTVRRRHAPEAPSRWSSSGMLAEATRYLDDPLFHQR